MPSNWTVGLKDEMWVDSERAGTWCSGSHACSVKQPLQLYSGFRLFRKGVLGLLSSSIAGPGSKQPCGCACLLPPACIAPCCLRFSFLPDLVNELAGCMASLLYTGRCSAHALVTRDSCCVERKSFHPCWPYTMISGMPSTLLHYTHAHSNINMYDSIALMSSNSHKRTPTHCPVCRRCKGVV
jgi:hypothetical protein